jgi:outer membrane protein assembly factor BamD
VKHLFFSLTCLGALGPLGCASFGTFANSGNGDVEVVYGVDAEDNLKRGELAVTAKNFAEAAKYFEYVKTKFPYLEAAKTAELKLGDTDFERDRFAEARDRYQNFVRLHPTHSRVDYAAYRAALTHYRDIPSDFFLLPPSSEKEQVEVKSALTAMNEFLLTYPDSQFGAEAKKLLGDIKRRLAEHELSVADFYAKRGRWPAVVGRLSVVAKSYGGVGYDERTFFGLYDAYQKLNEPQKAADVLRAYVGKYPEDPGAKRAQILLASLPPLVEAPKPTAVPDGAPDAGR